jgi:hypothetical protein
MAASLSLNHYSTCSAPREEQATQTRPHTAFSQEDLCRRGTTDTQDLAEFLKTSSPADFQKFLKKSPSEDHSFGTSYKKRFQFLRASASKSKLKPSSPLPQAVLPQKTSRGKPYLQIKVDHDNSSPRIELRSQDLEEQTRLSSYGLSNFSPSFRDSVLASTASPPQSVTDDGILSPAPWASSESKKSLDADIANTYRKFIISHPESSITTEGTSVRVPIEAVGRDSPSLSGYHTIQEGANSRNSYDRDSYTGGRRGSDPHSYMSSQQVTTPVRVRKRSSSLRRQSRGSYSSRSSVYSIGADGELDRDPSQPQRRHSRRAPPRPGPPPARSLPALPESRGSPSIPNRSARMSTVSAISVSARSEWSVASSTQFRYLDQQEALQQEGLQQEGLQQERMTREERVRARKARDMQQLKLRRQASQANLEQASVSSSSDPQSPCPDSPVMFPLPQRSSRSRSRPRTSATHRPSSNTLRIEQRNIQRLSMPSMPMQMLQSPTGDSSSGSSSKSNHSTHADTERESPEVLRARLEAIERKNKMLEKALIAVIRGTVGQDKRQADLQRAESLEEVIRQLTMLDMGSSTSGSILSAAENAS